MKIRVMITVLFSLLLQSGNAQAQVPFYQGKTIKVLVGTQSGVLYDQWARLMAAHIVKQIPGNPDYIVQNMPGAGHKIAANYLYNVA
ncbi:MAG: hypothetical protein HY694_06880, partial [Deltaproteobacteria bacterium]|nr:hypothetical protein [Deltaproteobacteria bacterium]